MIPCRGIQVKQARQILIKRLQTVFFHQLDNCSIPSQIIPIRGQVDSMIVDPPTHKRYNKQDSWESIFQFLLFIRLISK
jgi:hypothetical protein